MQKGRVIQQADTFFQWAVFFGSVLISVWLYNKLPQDYAGLISAAVLVPSLGKVAQKYFDTRMRFSAEIWTNRIIVGDTDSGRLAGLEFFIRRVSPSFFRQPLVHMFRPAAWKVVVGRIDQRTGSVSVTSKAIEAIAKADWLRREAGSNEVVADIAMQHLQDLFRYLSDKGDLNQEEIDQLATIRAAVVSRVKDQHGTVINNGEGRR